MSIWPHILMLGAMLMALSACEFEREGRQVLPQLFAGADTRLLAQDMVEITVSVARPREGALKAYADCVGAQYAEIRGKAYARRVTTFPDRNGLGDIVRERHTFLLADIPNSPQTPTARAIVMDCKLNDIPTV